MSRFLVLILLALSTASCTKKKGSTVPPVKGDYLITGQRGGFIMSTAHATYFRINNGELREDTSETYGYIPDDNSKFNFNYLLPSSKYDQVKDILTTIPAELLSRNNQMIGTLVPDLGYTDLRADINGVDYKWSFEGSQDASSAEVQAFVHRLRTDFY